MRRATKTWLGRIVAAALVAGALMYVPYHVYARSGLARTLQLRRELVALKLRNAQLRDETLRLGRQAEALRDDPEAIERVARADLGWVRPGEIVVDLDAARTPVADERLPSTVIADRAPRAASPAAPSRAATTHPRSTKREAR